MHSEFVVFDPLAIDELRFNMDDNGNVIEDKLKERIPYSVGQPIIPLPTNPINSFPKQELQTISNLVVQQVSERDYKLVSQAQLVVMWRPLYGGETHDGVNSEGAYARAKGIPIHSYHPQEDKKKHIIAFPANFGLDHSDVDNLFKAIIMNQENLEKKQKVDTHIKEI